MMRKRVRNVSLVLTLSVVVTLVGAPAAVPQCASTCMGALGAGMSCTLTILMTTFPGPPTVACPYPLVVPPPYAPLFGTSFMVTMGAPPTLCPPMGMLTPAAMITGIYHPATATGPATCGFMITFLCVNPITPTVPAPGATLMCLVGPMSPGGGLPVELMEFSVEDDTESESAETSG